MIILPQIKFSAALSSDYIEYFRSCPVEIDGEYDPLARLLGVMTGRFVSGSAKKKTQFSNMISL